MGEKKLVHGYELLLKVLINIFGKRPAPKIKQHEHCIFQFLFGVHAHAVNGHKYCLQVLQRPLQSEFWLSPFLDLVSISLFGVRGKEYIFSFLFSEAINRYFLSLLEKHRQVTKATYGRKREVSEIQDSLAFSQIVSFDF